MNPVYRNTLFSITSTIINTEDTDDTENHTTNRCPKYFLHLLNSFMVLYYSGMNASTNSQSNSLLTKRLISDPNTKPCLSLAT